MPKSHVNHSVNLSGLILNLDFPYLGASPDGIVNCSCCGVGCLETKYPSKYRDNPIEDMIFGSSGYLEFGSGGAVEIIKTHAYFYQIQTQLLVTQYDYSNFFVTLINHFVCIRIELGKELFEKISRKCKLFFEKVILPELLAKFFSEPTITNATSPGKVCYCNMSKEDDDLIGCDKENCKKKWFHLKCLLITKIPKGRWFCPECQKAKKQKNNFMNSCLTHYSLAFFS